MRWWVLRRATWDNMRGVCYRLLRSWRRVAHQLHASCSPLSFSLCAMWTRLDGHFFLVNLILRILFFHQDGHQFDVENSTWASSLCGRSAGWALMSFKVNSTDHWSEGWHLPHPVCLRHTGQLRDQCFCGWQQAAHVFVAPDEVHGRILNNLISQPRDVIMFAKCIEAIDRSCHHSHFAGCLEVIGWC